MELTFHVFSTSIQTLNALALRVHLGGQVPQDIAHGDDPGQRAVVIDDGHVPKTAEVHPLHGKGDLRRLLQRFRIRRS